VNAIASGATPERRLRRAARAVALGLALAGAALLGNAGYIHAKAWAAQVLIHRAWDARRAGEPTPRPWPWADTFPLARLMVPALGVDEIVLEGASGRTLAFGPAQLDSSAVPGAPGVTVLTGHRDTHFAFLEKLWPGEALTLETPDGVPHRYQVTGRKVVHRDDARLPAEAADGGAWLMLATCWPFDAIDPGTPWRFIVTARAQ